MEGIKNQIIGQILNCQNPETLNRILKILEKEEVFEPLSLSEKEKMLFLSEPLFMEEKEKKERENLESHTVAFMSVWQLTDINDNFNLEDQEKRKLFLATLDNLGHKIEDEEIETLLAQIRSI